jgi:hypothetical protein
VDPDWLVAGVRDWLEAVAPDARRSDRALPLLGLPLVGTGAGGASSRRDQVLAELLPALDECARRSSVDIALVLNDQRDHAAAQAVRMRAGRECWALDEALRDAAASLAERATRGRLSLFLGAGVSRAAGLPLWEDLIVELMDAAGIDEQDRAAVRRLEVPDQAEFCARRLEGGGAALTAWLKERFGPRPHALAHSLLAALPVREAVTTNWDALFEQAVRDTGRSIAALPYDDPADADAWLLKLHGDVAHGDDLVVRRSDYLRFGTEQSALAGVVQSLLFTRHMLFVGFSLVDDNFIRIADDVTRLLDRYAGDEHHSDAADRRLGTTVGLHRDPAKPLLWPHLDHLFVGAETEDDDSAGRARTLEVFLDLLSARVDRGQAYLLDERYAGLLDEPDTALARHLAELADHAPELEKSSSWSQVRALLDTLGRPPG